MWWEELNDVDKASPINIHFLVETCEDIFSREREGWSSTSTASKLLGKGEEADVKGDASNQV